jgi:hypothetical protein
MVNMYQVAQEEASCLGRLVFIWGVYGLAMAALWQAAHGNRAAETLAWGIAAIAAFWLLRGMREV